MESHKDPSLFSQLVTLPEQLRRPEHTGTKTSQCTIIIQEEIIAFVRVSKSARDVFEPDFAMRFCLAIWEPDLAARSFDSGFNRAQLILLAKLQLDLTQCGEMTATFFLLNRDSFFAFSGLFDAVPSSLAAPAPGKDIVQFLTEYL